MILDTNFLIDLLEDKDDALEKLRELRERKEPLMMPPGVLYELYTGLDSEDRARRIENELKMAELTPAVEKEAARIRQKLNRKGEPTGSIDYLIAGTARHLNEKILTNDQNFNKLEGLQVEDFKR
jgi:predicted nucleic acid-binding protein